LKPGDLVNGASKIKGANRKSSGTMLPGRPRGWTAFGVREIVIVPMLHSGKERRESPRDRGKNSRRSSKNKGNQVR